MTSLNNIEKLIQMATIEQMYSMLQKMKNDISTNISTDEQKVPKDDINERLINLENANLELSKEVTSSKYRINHLELEIELLKNSRTNDFKDNYSFHPIKGQQLLTQYPGFVNTIDSNLPNVENIHQVVEQVTEVVLESATEVALESATEVALESATEVALESATEVALESAT